jgi:hypothetical protein
MKASDLIGRWFFYGVMGKHAAEKMMDFSSHERASAHLNPYRGKYQLLSSESWVDLEGFSDLEGLLEFCVVHGVRTDFFLVHVSNMVSDRRKLAQPRQQDHPNHH